ncbi:hypothetical protein HY502_00025 [Candidatus Woesebacteria bacterium]|nr:hypothetical protein [Candidatus Woesebacteria bacterium]
MRNKGFAPIIILVVIALAVAGYFAYQNMQLKKSADNKQQAAVPSTTSYPSPTANPTANWKTYTNQEYNFSFKYPSDLAVRENKNPSLTENAEIVLVGELSDKFFYVNLGYLEDGTDKADMKFEYKDSVIASKQAKMQTITTGGKVTQVSYGVKNENTDMVISSNFEEYIFDQILSTFKFIE